MNNHIYLIKEDDELNYFTYSEEEAIYYIQNIFNTQYLDTKSDLKYILDSVNNNQFFIVEIDTMQLNSYERVVKSFTVYKIDRYEIKF
jgi:hypothetical protein